MTIPQDEYEHSIEMQLPFLYVLINEFSPLLFSDPQTLRRLICRSCPNYGRKHVSGNGRRVQSYFNFLPSRSRKHVYRFNRFLSLVYPVVRTWRRGDRFNYYYYDKDQPHLEKGTSRSKFCRPAIHKNIEKLDKDGMNLIKAGDYSAFLEYIEETGNTICGR